MQAAIPFIILLYPLINLAEAWLEKIVIDLKDPRLKNYRELNDMEHFRSLILAVLIACPFIFIAVAEGLYFLLPGIIINRRLLFDHPLKAIRDKPIWAIEGRGVFDSFFASIYGKRGGWYELITEAVITVASIILQFIYG